MVSRTASKITLRPGDQRAGWFPPTGDRPSLTKTTPPKPAAERPATCRAVHWHGRREHRKGQKSGPDLGGGWGLGPYQRPSATGCPPAENGLDQQDGSIPDDVTRKVKARICIGEGRGEDSRGEDSESRTGQGGVSTERRDSAEGRTVQRGRRGDWRSVPGGVKESRGRRRGE